jgi:hypothetical protein
MLCPVCRSDIPDTFDFCDQCGSRLKQSVPAYAPPQGYQQQYAPPPDPWGAQPAAPRVAALVALSGRRYPVTRPDTLIGRHDPNSVQQPEIDLTLDDPNKTVSRRHARVVQRDGRFLLQVEPTARNPGEKDGARLQAGVLVPLTHGDRFQLGKVELVFEG